MLRKGHWFNPSIAHQIRPRPQCWTGPDFCWRPGQGEVLVAAHDERADRGPVRARHRCQQQRVRAAVLLGGGGEPVGLLEEEGVDLVEVDEVGDRQVPRATGSDGLQLLRFDEVDLVTGAFVDPLVADAVGGAAFELVEVDRVSSVAVKSPTGMDTSPKLIDPVQIARAISSPLPLSSRRARTG